MYNLFEKPFVYLGRAMALCSGSAMFMTPLSTNTADARQTIYPTVSSTTSLMARPIEEGTRILPGASRKILQVDYIQAQHSAKCLHVPGGDRRNGTHLTQWDCLPQNNVRWEISSVGSGLYQIKSKLTNKCVYIPNGSRENGAPIVQLDCMDQAQGQWKLVRNSDGYSHIVNAQSGKCLHVSGASNDNNAFISQWDCIQQGNVKWKLTSTPSNNAPASESVLQPAPQSQRYRVKMWFVIVNSNDGFLDNRIECYGELRIDGELYWQIPREQADNNQREAGQSLEVSSSNYVRKEFIFNKPQINYEIFLRDADEGSPDDDVYQGSRRNFNLESSAGKGEQSFQFKNERTGESSYLKIIVDQLP